MTLKQIKKAASTASSVLDINGDGVVDYRDAIAAAKIAGAATLGAGASVAAGALAGSTIVTAGAAAIATKIAMVSGAAAGAFIAGTFGATTAVSYTMVQVGSFVVFGSSAVTSVSGPLLAAAAGAGSWVGQVTTGKIAGMTIIKSIALSNAVSAGEVLIIGGIPIGVTAALTTGLIAILIVGAFAYYVLTKDAVPSLEDVSVIPSPA
ncbi:MAG: hypothetical protein WCO04_00145 [Pseudomonadota bacterium]